MHVNKKIDLLKIIKSEKNYNYNSYLMETLLKEKHLNFLIDKLDDDNIKLPDYTIEKKKYFTSEEQFISVLDKFIYYFKDHYIMPNILSDYSLRNILSINNPNLDILFSKIYIHDNDYIDYYRNKFNKAITYAFISNLQKFQYCSSTIENFIKKHNLNINNNLNDKDIEKISKILRKIVVCNYNEINLPLLFLNYEFYFDSKKGSSSEKRQASFHFFIMVYNMFITEFNEKEKAINELIKY